MIELLQDLYLDIYLISLHPSLDPNQLQSPMFAQNPELNKHQVFILTQHWFDQDAIAELMSLASFILIY